MGFASCESTTDPKLQLPDQAEGVVSFEINTPAFANEELVLGEEGTLPIIVHSQPDYGFPAAVTYTLQASLTGDWSNPKAVYELDYDLTQQGDGRHTLVLTQAALADAMTALNGIWQEVDKESGEQTIYNADGTVYTGSMTDLGPNSVYVRAVAQLGSMEETKCYSNAIELKSVNWFVHFRAPGYIFLVGTPQGWDIGNGSMMLWERDDEIGTGIYRGEFEIDATTDMFFRFYTELGNWGDNGQLPSLGSAANDGDNTEVVLKDNFFQGTVVYGKGSWFFSQWPGGTLYLVVDLSSKKLSVSDKPIE